MRPSILVLAALLLLCSRGGASQPHRDLDQIPIRDQDLDQIQDQIQDQDQDQDLDQELDLELRHHRLLQRARSAGLLPQDWSKRAVEDLLMQLSPPAPAAPVATATGGGRLTLERSVETSVPRERKAGCKNFYWKGFTSC